MRKSAFIFGFLIILSCSTQTISTDFDRNQDFSLIKDYHFEWLDSSASELDVNRIQTAIQNELNNKSMSYNPNSSNKIIIKLEKFISESQNSNIGIGIGGGGGGFGTSVGIGVPITSEKLNQNYLISLYNNVNQLVWQGKLDIKMSTNGGPDLLDSNIQKGIQKIFKKYPFAK